MDADNLLLSTDYPHDKVLETYSGSFSAAARYGVSQPRVTTNSIAHGIGTYGLIIGAFSTDNIVWLPFGIVNADTSGLTPTFQTREVTAYCTTTDVVIVCSNYLSSSATIYYALQLLARD